MSTIGFVTCHPAKLKHYFPTATEPNLVPVEPHFTPDDQIAVDDLRKHGFQVEPVFWGCPVQSLERFDLIIIRSPWDYMESSALRQNFLDWIDSLEQLKTPVYNPPALMKWLVDKHYLQDLHASGVNIVPTVYVERNGEIDLAELIMKKGQFILKPCISASGVGLLHIKTEEDAKTHQKEINEGLKSNAYMLQDFIPEITSQGEWSLIFIGGQYSHAVHKKPKRGSILIHAEQGGTLSFISPKDEIVNFAKAAFQKVLPAFEKSVGIKFSDPDPILYLRLDIIETSSGMVLSECEGVEPELFFRANPNAKTLFRKALESRLFPGHLAEKPLYTITKEL